MRYRVVTTTRVVEVEADNAVVINNYLYLKNITVDIVEYPIPGWSETKVEKSLNVAVFSNWLYCYPAEEGL